MKPNQQEFTRQYPMYSDGIVQQPFYGSAPQFQNYPGVNNPYSGYFPSETQTALTAPNSGSSSFNLNQIKGMIDRVGGIEGVMGHVTRLQKIIQTLQQMSPMLKLLLSSFGAKSATAATANTTNSASDGLAPVRRRQNPSRKIVKKTIKRRARRG